TAGGAAWTLRAGSNAASRAERRQACSEQGAAKQARRLERRWAKQCGCRQPQSGWCVANQCRRPPAPQRRRGPTDHGSGGSGDGGGQETGGVAGAASLHHVDLELRVSLFILFDTIVLLSTDLLL
uniref:Uncharacterized protein n=1 Tax=Oryza glaberrima TaxID=4538 RepID=I1P129_ORYGL